MADQKVSDAALLKLEGDLTIKFEAVKGQVKKLHATIDNLEGKWQGIGANHFNQKQTEINNRMVDLAKQLAGFQESIKAARTISGDNEDEIRAALTSVDVQGPTGGSKSNLNGY
ncbi:WXG100 family type VII secretion target [Streptomyces rubiginosohelvolus]|uniref:WXG100 family type VII secretion target n=1 Tax=Streptomyces TaxID=1883 RepID=UPI000BF0DCAF|nr:MULTISPECIES: WXG100 family type VII secretion target [unclassified Streptomyces]MBK3556991.1 WXG100 family type VII secretion target [Streptomyces sp. MBT56]MBK3602743.1 WXG100 family type VII secretion target [Streptomyces sp. MBT54]MBK3614983.1 WXG100 family type VII secretion target [Streptomyces sp. MBT98]MBK6042944.1 WXG100 family type VII secretion target [Streptomyces sp. MBT55]MZG03925.1 WXG100 family type VII secretion target [Streptomyces sp. SID5614]